MNKPIVQRIAVFQRLGGDYLSYWAEGFDASGHGYVRVSELVEVTFPPLTQAVVAEQQLTELEKLEATIRGEFQRKLDQITDARAKLLALAAPMEPAEDRRAADCDVCCVIPGVRTVIAAGGVETWICDSCAGDEPEESLRDYERREFD